MENEKDFRADDDETLFRLLRNRDKDAVVAIFDRYSKELYSFAFREIERRMPEAEPSDAARNILIIVFASMYDHHEQLPTDTKLLDFLFGIANRAVALYLQQKD
jgi:DNA-directed RNA polymerase specialized sigma24 family protein